MTATKEEDPSFGRILSFLLKSRGFDAHPYKPNYIKRRISVRMRATGAEAYRDYLEVLHRDPREASLLLDRMTIHVTGFFRDPGVYRAFQENILPSFSDLSRPMRIWCAGCSTGEEAYSIAAVLKEASRALPGLSFELLATDIDPASISTAERGEYPKDSLAKVPRALADRWFRISGSKVLVSPDLRRTIRFRTHDLLGNWPPELSGFNMVFCRNLLIYMTAARQQVIYEKFAGALAPDGFLILGLTETLLGPSRRYFRCVDVKNRIYRLEPGKE
jgi:chemotaxis protein methyltransferase CheR